MNTDGRIIDKGFHTSHEVNFVTIPEHDYEYLKYKSRLVEEYESMINRIQNKNKHYREALEDIKNVWKVTDTHQEYMDTVHDIIKDLEGEE